MLPTNCDVLVVGAGPAGLVTAVQLARRGVDVTVVDRVAQGHNTSRAAAVHARTLEVLDGVGVAGPLVRRGIPAARVTLRDGDRTLLTMRFDGLPTPFPYVLLVPQSVTEEVLLDRLTALGGRVLRPYRVVGLSPDGTGSRVTFAGGETVRARFVVGADGMHSTVRQLAGIGFHGTDSEDSFVLADVRIDTALPRDEVILFFSRTGLLVWAPLPDGSVRIVAEVADPPEHPDVAYAQSLLDARGPTGRRSTVTEVLWGSRFRVHHRVAESFRAGPVLLAGDAGHVHSPAGGQGMNLGLRDGAALGTALADVLSGAPETVLDAYAAARRSVAREVVGFAGRLTRVGTAAAPLRPLRNTALRLLSTAPAARRQLAGRLAGLADR
ncbi:FAD-dependent oxidoreductase [Micromonospora sp. NBC_01699]|uniref:FAD-dependent oxidoreductase n=1 Tax=Micromonospora sp. NBC_01699 TaxID=2975984 RepID=UPI002E2B0AA2|nr:FAD-dependent oxidoreductase [Micromonospora sp. NBC_01699]